jgi:peptidoglycan/LPS O-acetylase OafA/YrhL
MGVLRCLLAILVLISHTQFRLENFNVGVFAVVSFLIISGFVMRLLVTRHYGTPDKLPMFYLDRIGRIFPQYIVYLSITVVLVSHHWIGYGFVEQCDAYGAALNFLALPLSFAQFIGLRCQYLPQAWSLGLELSFYLIVPFLIYFPRVAIAAALLSLSIFIASLAQHLSFEAFAYRTLPGTLFIFVVGMSFASRVRHARLFPISVWLASAAAVTVLYDVPEFGFPPYSKEVLVGLLVGIPVVAILKSYRSSQLDELLGNLSYGIFLDHVLFINVLHRLLGFTFSSSWELFILIDVSMLASYATYRLIEQPVLELRRQLRMSKPSVVVAS